MRISDWSSGVCSSDLAAHDDAGAVVVAERRGLSRTAPVEVHEACLDGLHSHLVTEGGQGGAGEGPGDLADDEGARAGVLEHDQVQPQARLARLPGACWADDDDAVRGAEQVPHGATHLRADEVDRKSTRLNSSH